MNFDIDLSQYKVTIIEYGTRTILAILVLLIGLWVIRVIMNGFKRVLTKRSVEESLKGFLSTFVGITLKTLLVVSILQMVGIAVTSFVAILGAAGLAIGMALSGTLQNFAGGVMILIFKPYKAGDVLEAQGYTGTVKEIQIFNTILTTWDNKTIIIPNGKLSNNSMINYSTEETRKVEWIIGISYNDDIDKAREIIKKTIFEDERILDDPSEYFVNVNALADSSVNFKVRAKVIQANYWPVFFEKTEAIKKAFDANDITFPFPQRDVHLHQNA